MALNIPQIMIYVSYEGLHAQNSPTQQIHMYPVEIVNKFMCVQKVQ